MSSQPENFTSPPLDSHAEPAPAVDSSSAAVEHSADATDAIPAPAGSSGFTKLMDLLNPAPVISRPDDALGLEDFVCKTYLQELDFSSDDAELYISSAVTKLRAKHPDWDYQVARMNVLARMVRPSWDFPLNADAYLEVLYAAAKFTDVARHGSGLAAEISGAVQ